MLVAPVAAVIVVVADVPTWDALPIAALELAAAAALSWWKRQSGKSITRPARPKPGVPFAAGKGPTLTAVGLVRSVPAVEHVVTSLCVVVAGSIVAAHFRTRWVFWEAGLQNSLT